MKNKEIKENIHLIKVLLAKLLIIILIENSMQISQMKNGIQTLQNLIFVGKMLFITNIRWFQW